MGAGLTVFDGTSTTFRQWVFDESQPVAYFLSRRYLEYYNSPSTYFSLTVASLLSCLHQLRAENIRLEEHVNNLVARRDHLLAVNARLAIPLSQVPQSQNPNPGKQRSITTHRIPSKILLHILPLIHFIAFNTLHLNGSAEPGPRSRSQHMK